MDGERLQFLEVGADRRRIALRAIPGRGPTVLWCGGFASDMGGTKATHLAAWAAGAGRAYTRFDYSGHGESGGRFEDGTISRWAEEARAVYDALPPGEAIVVGSSMGGWIALMLARDLLCAGRAGRAAAVRLAGMVLIAPAPDFTEDLIWQQLPPEARAAIARDGMWLRPSDYDTGPQPITRALIEDGRRHLVLGGPIETGCPVRILHGTADPDVPWQHGMRLIERLAHDDAAITLVKDGDHRLSTPEDLARLVRTIEELAGP